MSLAQYLAVGSSTILVVALLLLSSHTPVEGSRQVEGIRHHNTPTAVWEENTDTLHILRNHRICRHWNGVCTHAVEPELGYDPLAAAWASAARSVGRHAVGRVQRVGSDWMPTIGARRLALVA